MALSGTLQNFAGGVLILLLKPYKIGDYIEAQGYAGTVTKIEIFNTLICTADNKSIIIPNGGLSTGTINNYSTQAYRRVEWSIGISYGDSVEAARREILKMFASDSRIVQGSTPDAPDSDRSPIVRLGQLADSSVQLTVRAWVKSGDFWNVYFDYNERIYAELPTLAGISFPFPQLDVHVTASQQQA